MKSEKNRVYVIAGPTATGKSALAVRLSEMVSGEIISADSVQVYRGLDIGSAKIRPDEMRGIAHHLIDVLDPHEECSVSLYRTMASGAMDDILSRGRTPVICGGTGFYIQSVIYGMDFDENEDEEKRRKLRRELCALYEKGGTAALSRLLSEIDHAAFEQIDIFNPRRVIRAIEYMELHGTSITTHNKEQAKRRLDPPFDIRFFVLYLDREKMYRRIDERVDEMFRSGFENEVRELVKNGFNASMPAAQAIGYKEMLMYLAGDMSLPEASSAIKSATRHYAKRQLTWFRREKNAIWIDTDEGDPLDEIRRYL